MEFGKVQDTSTIDFSLMVTPDFSVDLLSQMVVSSTPRFYIGATGWSMPEWVGTWYPMATNTSGYLKAYCKQFNAIECNTTFYQIPSRQTIERWRSVATPGFRFCPKIYQGISRADDFGVKDQLMEQYWDAISGLSPFLGPVFLQLPESFELHKMSEFCAFLTSCPSELPLFIEFRHRSWFADFSQIQPLVDILRLRKYGWVQTDVAGRRDVLHQYLTCDTAFIRFVSCGNKNIDRERLSVWASKLESWYKKGLSTAYFFVHDFDGANVPLLVRTMIEIVDARIDALQLHMPQNYNQSKQLTLF